MNTRRLARVVTGGIIGTAAVLAVSGCTDLMTDTAADDATVRDPITAVRFATDSGNVTIRTGETTSVHREMHYTDERPGTTHKVDGDVLVLESCPERNCWIDYEVVVPAGSTVSGTVGSGDVDVAGLASANITTNSGNATARGIAGTVNVEVGSGEVVLDDIGGDVAVRSGSGDLTLSNTRAGVNLAVGSGEVDGTGIGGPATVESGSGDVRVALTSPQNVDVQASSGEVTVHVPQDEYRVDLEAGSGEITSDVPGDPNGAHTVTVRTSSGDIALKWA